MNLKTERLMETICFIGFVHWIATDQSYARSTEYNQIKLIQVQLVQPLLRNTAE